MLERTINVARTASYCQLGEITGKTESIWFVCHGYGQLAKFFIQNFKCLQDEKTVIIAPEALSRFYINGFSGRVGASWMTKVERLSEIDDYTAYFSQLYKTTTAGLDIGSINLTVLGFSQGTTTASRWIAREKPEVTRLILWAGSLPVEIDSKKAFEPFSNMELVLVYGLDDEVVKPSKVKKVKVFLENNGVQLDIRTFKGGHKLDEKILLDLKN